MNSRLNLTDTSAYYIINARVDNMIFIYIVHFYESPDRNAATFAFSSIVLRDSSGSSFSFFYTRVKSIFSNIFPII